MLRYFQVTFVIFCCSMLLCCNDAEKNREAQLFYDNYDKITDIVVEPPIKFSEYFAIVAPLAKKAENYQLDDNKIDSLRNLYEALIASLDKAIHKLNDLGEFDTSFRFRFVSTTVKHYKHLKNGYASTIPTFLYVYKIGWKLASPSEKEIILNASVTLNNQVKSMKAETDTLKFQLTKFIKKYNIQDR